MMGDWEAEEEEGVHAGWTLHGVHGSLTFPMT